MRKALTSSKLSGNPNHLQVLGETPRSRQGTNFQPLDLGPSFTDLGSALKLQQELAVFAPGLL